ncbi:nitroreductase family protein [Roseimaritima ulvae]|nr:hypothetical protein [Roseimaritima ulvae]
MTSATMTTELTPVQHDIIKAAAAAPSPDNNQPWKFVCQEDSIQVFFDKTRKLESDVDYMFDMTGIGGAVENAIIAASHHDLVAEPVWLGNVEKPDLKLPVVELKLTSGGSPDPLNSVVEERCTCRKPYSKQPLETAILDSLEAAAVGRFPQAQIDWITDPRAKQRFGNVVAAMDSVRFRIPECHRELYKQLRFSRNEVEQTRDGLDVRTLELPPGVATMLKGLRSWEAMQAVHRLRLTPLLTIPSKVAVQKSAAIAVVSISTASIESYMHGGRAIERLWLAATALDLSMHPLGSPAIFLPQAKERPQFRSLIERSQQETFELLPRLGNRTMQLAFRVGRSKPPTARSLRREVSEVLGCPK